MVYLFWEDFKIKAFILYCHQDYFRFQAHCEVSQEEWISRAQEKSYMQCKSFT